MKIELKCTTADNSGNRVSFGEIVEVGKADDQIDKSRATVRLRDGHAVEISPKVLLSHKELLERIETLEDENDQLLKRNATLESENQQLSARIESGITIPDVSDMEWGPLKSEAAQKHGIDVRGMKRHEVEAAVMEARSK